MQTQKPAISLLNSLNNNAQPARGGNNVTPDVSFNQVLSREVSRQPARQAERQPERQPERQAERVNTPAPAQQGSKAAESASKEKNTGPLPPPNQTQPENTATQASQTSSGSTAPGQPGSESGASSETTDASQQQSDALAATTTDPTAALLALVASFNQPATSKAGPAAGADAGSVAGINIKADKAGEAAILAPQAVAAKEDKPADPFAALLPTDAKAATQEQPELQDAAPKLAAAKPDNTPRLTAADARPEATPQLAASNDATIVNQVATRTAVKADAAAPQTLSEGNNSTTITAVAQTSAAANAPAIAKLQAQLAPRVGNPGWDQALGQHVVYMAGQGSQTASLTLNPPDLGPLQVVLNISNDQANASFTAAQPEVRAALEAAMPKLREMMSEAGISLGSATVGTSLPNQQQSTPGEQARNQAGHGGNGNGPADLREDGARTVVTRPVSAALGLVDTFV